MPDHVEAIVAQALDDAGIAYTQRDATGLDFYLPDSNIHIECKRHYTDRITGQMKRVDNLIVIQGIDAARAFAKLIAR